LLSQVAFTLPEYFNVVAQRKLDGHLAARRAQQASEIGDRALRLARDILDLDEFRDLALPGGLAKRGRPEPTTTLEAAPGRKRRRSGEPPKTSGNVSSTRGRRILEKFVGIMVAPSRPQRCRGKSLQ
jgi:hypothetical protein